MLNTCIHECPSHTKVCVPFLAARLSSAQQARCTTRLRLLNRRSASMTRLTPPMAAAISLAASVAATATYTHTREHTRSQ